MLYPSSPPELFEEALHPGEVLTLVRIYLVQFPCYLKKIPCSGKINSLLTLQNSLFR